MSRYRAHEPGVPAENASEGIRPGAGRYHRLASSLALGLLLLFIYLATLAPGLTWANSGSDGGDLITAAAVGGVPHPTGYPTYLLLARLFQLLPLGSLAYRTNLMSALCTALAAVLLSDAVYRMQNTFEPHQRAGGWIAGLAYGLAPLVWSQAVITEVYALLGFWIALILWQLSIPPRGGYADISFGLLLGLLPGAHMTGLLFIPAFMLARTFQVRERTQRTIALAIRDQLAGLGIGLLVFAILPLRAWQHPPVNWGNAGTPGGFWWLVSGQLYRDFLSLEHVLSIWQRLRFTAALLLEQAGLAGLLLGAFGLVWRFRPSRWILLTVWLFAASTVFSILYHADDSYVYAIPAMLSFATWIGWGSAFLSERLTAHWRSTGHLVNILIALYLFGLALWHWPQVDASHDSRAENFASQALASLPQKAIVLAGGDAAVFGLWYEVFALKQRTDLAVLAEDLLPFEWYRRSLREAYPGLVVPDHPDNVWAVMLQDENKNRPFCQVSAEGSTMIACR